MRSDGLERLLEMTGEVSLGTGDNGPLFADIERQFFAPEMPVCKAAAKALFQQATESYGDNREAAESLKRLASNIDVANKPRVMVLALYTDLLDVDGFFDALIEQAQKGDVSGLTAAFNHRVQRLRGRPEGDREVALLLEQFDRASEMFGILSTGGTGASDDQGVQGLYAVIMLGPLIGWRPAINELRLFFSGIQDRAGERWVQLGVDVLEARAAGPEWLAYLCGHYSLKPVKEWVDKRVAHRKISGEHVIDALRRLQGFDDINKRAIAKKMSQQFRCADVMRKFLMWRLALLVPLMGSFLAGLKPEEATVLLGDFPESEFAEALRCASLGRPPELATLRELGLVRTVNRGRRPEAKLEEKLEDNLWEGFVDQVDEEPHAGPPRDELASPKGGRRKADPEEDWDAAPPPKTTKRGGGRRKADQEEDWDD
jgi:hypothetical protein